jgi:ligand-binding SRPBCC domain-containing protein
MSKGLFKYWKHTHVFQKTSEKQTRITDKIEFELLFSFFGKIFEKYILNKLEKIFMYR